MLAYGGLSCGQCGPILWLCWPMLASCWPMWSQKIRKMGTAKKRCKTQDILMVGGPSWGYVGPSWGYVGLSWGYVGPSWGYVAPAWGYVGPSWRYVGPSWGYVGPSWGYVGPSWGLCWPILRPMLAHVGPSWAIRSEKWQKVGRAQNTVKRGGFWRHGEGRRQGARPLSPTERRELPYGNARARGPLAGFLSWRSSSAPPDHSALHFIAVWAWKVYWMRTCCRNIFLRFFGTYLLE